MFELLSESDLILGLGMDGVDFIREWSAGEVDLLTAHADHDPSFPNRPVRGSLVPMLEHLADVVAPQRPTRGADRARAARQAALDDLRAGTGSGHDPPDAPPGGMAIHDLFAPLRTALGSDVALIPDVGLHKLYLAQYWSVPGPHGFLVANGLSAMGWAVPSALAYKLEFPRRPVMAVVGDGGLLMYAGELATLRRLAPAGLVGVLLNDASLALIHANAEELDLDVWPTDFKPPDFVAPARSFDLEAARATSPGHALELITQGLQRPHPVIVEVPLAFGPYRRMA